MSEHATANRLLDSNRILNTSPAATTNSNPSPQPSPAASDRTDQGYVTRHGRQYFARSLDVNPFPWDDSERLRQDYVSSAIYDTLLGHRPSVVARKRPNQHGRILDVGSGTGWWVLSMADAIGPTFEVIGFDLPEPHLPASMLGPNERILVGQDFSARTWPVEPESCDLVHSDQTLGKVENWTEHFKKAFKYLKPGGVIESVEIDWLPRYDRPPNPQDAQAFLTWYSELDQASRSIGQPIAYSSPVFQDALAHAGFTDIHHAQYALYCGVRAKSEYPDEAAYRYAFDMATQMSTLSIVEDRGWSGMAMELLTRYRGWSQEEVEQLGQRVSAAVTRGKNPFYFNV